MPNARLLNVTLLTFRLAFKPRELYNALVDRWSVSAPAALTPEQWRTTQAIRLRVLNVFVVWSTHTHSLSVCVCVYVCVMRYHVDCDVSLLRCVSCIVCSCVYALTGTHPRSHRAGSSESERGAAAPR